MSNLERAIDILRSLARGSETGLRLSDITEDTRLAKTTVHRLLNALLKQGLVEFDSVSNRYHLSFELFVLGSAAANRFNIVDLAKPGLIRLAEQTEDTVYLTIRHRYDAVCVDRVEGTFPIKALTSSIGGRQPLGYGAASIALLMELPDGEVQHIIETNRIALQSSPTFDLVSFSEALRRARLDGYVFRSSTRVAGIGALAMPIMNHAGRPVGAISISAIDSRMEPDRRTLISAAMKEEISAIEKQLSVRSPAGAGTILSAS